MSETIELGLDELIKHAVHTVHDFVVDEVYYMPVPNATLAVLTSGTPRGIATLEYVSKELAKRHFSRPALSKSEQLWAVAFYDKHRNSSEVLQMESNASVYLGSALSYFFTNWWYAYAFRLNAEASGAWSK